jgi:L-iditol 2-dehydrogenase
VLVRVEVALTCGTDLKVWKQGFHARMIKPPAFFGHELAGVIEEQGRSVNGGVHKGMRVLPANSAPCNACFYCRRGQPNLCEDLLFNNGAYAEYIRIPGRIVRQNMLEIPEGVSFVDAAMAEPLACVLRGIHETGIRPADTAVVIGCGPIGLKFIRVLSSRGVRVIALGKRKSQTRAAERLGAVAAFDISEIENPVRLVRELSEGGRGADAVVEAVGTAVTWQWAVQMARAVRTWSSIRPRFTIRKSRSNRLFITRRNSCAKRSKRSRAAKFAPAISSRGKCRLRSCRPCSST